MEKRLQKLIFSILLILILPLSAQDVSQERMVRFSLWASMEAYPGVDELKRDSFANPTRKIREISPFILSGMVYGWKFVYTPYDKARGVQEYFELSPVQELSDEEIKSIKYAKPWIENSVLNCWVEFRRSDQQIHIYKGWQSILMAKIKGEGYANYSLGFDGIKEACTEALKNAVRSYERKWIKSKPKEISGTVFMYEPPKIGLTSGRYKVTLDFFMETDRIIEYKTF